MKAARAALLATALAGCGGGATGPTPIASPSPGPDAFVLPVPPQTAQFVAALRQAGGGVQGTVMREPGKSYPWIPLPVAVVHVEDHWVAAFEYPTDAAVEDALRHTSADGHEFASAQVSWISDPHIYRSDRLIVLYVGTSERMLDLLRRVLGPQVAGR